MGPISCPETSLSNYHSTVRKIPKERRSPFLQLLENRTGTVSNAVFERNAQETCDILSSLHLMALHFPCIQTSDISLAGDKIKPD